MAITLDTLIAHLNAVRDHHGGHTAVAVRIITPYDVGEYLDINQRHGPVVSTLDVVLITREVFEVPDAG